MKSAISMIYVLQNLSPDNSFSDFLSTTRTDIEFLVYDTVCSEETRLFLQSFSNDSRVKVRSCPSWTLAQCYNDGIVQSEGQFLNFCKDTVSFPSERFNQAFSQLQQSARSIVSFVPFQRVLGKQTKVLNFKTRNSVISLYDMPYCCNLCLASLFIRRTALEYPAQLRFDESLPWEFEELFLIRLYEQTGCYAIRKGGVFYQEYLYVDGYNYPLLYEKDWYTKTLRDILLPFLREKPDSVIRQASLIRLLEIRLAGNLDNRNKTLLNAEEREAYFQLIAELLQLIPDRIIAQFDWPHRRALQRFMPMNMLRLKYGTSELPVALMPAGTEAKPESLVCFHEQPIERMSMVDFSIRAINYKDQTLTFDGELRNVYFANYDEVSLYLICNGKKYKAKQLPIWGYTKYFGAPVRRAYMCQVSIPRKAIRSASSFHFEACYRDWTDKISCVFPKVQSHINEQLRRNYWDCGDFILRYSKVRRDFLVRKSTLVNRAIHELRLLWEIFRQKKLDPAVRREVLLLRLSYFLTRPFYRNKAIWLTFDQLFKGGDNGEYFYRYVSEHHSKDAKIYYVLNEDAQGYQELQQKYGTVLKFKSFKLRFMALHAKIIFATRVDVKLYCGFDPVEERYIRDLFNAEIMCLQHGLTIQKIAEYQNRLFDNQTYYFCVSPYEIANVRKPIYGYDPEKVLLTGAPRYDGLVGQPKRQILITPTWRRNVTAGTNEKGKQNEYSQNFKNTVYFRIYNSLINNQKLIDCARRTGYKLIYLIHPILSPQIGDFDTNDYVQIQAGSDVNYETILKESMLMVTDYSGIQFDFAYMRRSLVYYHPEELPPQYDESGLDYSTMSLGPVCKTQSEIVDTLCEMMERDCALDDVYRQRIEDFFPFHDQNNCKRVYEAVQDILSNRKG